MKKRLLCGAIAVAVVGIAAAQTTNLAALGPDQQEISRGLPRGGTKSALVRGSLNLGPGLPEPMTVAARRSLAVRFEDSSSPDRSNLPGLVPFAGGLGLLRPEFAATFISSGSPVFAEGEYRALVSFIKGAAVRARGEQEARRWALGTYLSAVGLCGLALLGFLLRSDRRPAGTEDSSRPAGGGQPFAA